MLIQYTHCASLKLALRKQELFWHDKFLPCSRIPCGFNCSPSPVLGAKGALYFMAKALIMLVFTSARRFVQHGNSSIPDGTNPVTVSE